jgi:hypothetical protein
MKMAVYNRNIYEKYRKLKCAQLCSLNVYCTVTTVGTAVGPSYAMLRVVKRDRTREDRRCICTDACQPRRKQNAGTVAASVFAMRVYRVALKWPSLSR